MIELVAASGYEAVTIRSLAKRARVSTGAFYKHYTSTDDCLLCTFDQVCGHACRRVTEAGRKEPEPQRRLVRAVECLFLDMAANPRAATFMLRAAPTVGPAFADDLWRSAMRLGAALEPCIRSDDDPPLNPLLLEGIVAGLARIGGLALPAAGEGEVRAVAAEAVEWIARLSARPGAEAEAPVTAGPRRLQNDAWEGVLGDERAMMLAATFRIARDGYHQLSVSRICREAGVSRRDFTRNFDDLEDCFVAAVEERAVAVIEAWASSRDPSVGWRGAVYDAIRALCEATEDDLPSARVLFADLAAAGTKGIDSRDRLISHVARVLRTAAPTRQAPSPLAAEASAAAAWAIVRRLVQEETVSPAEALPVLALFIETAVEDKKDTAGDERCDSRVRNWSLSGATRFPTSSGRD